MSASSRPAPEQLVLELLHLPALEAEDFLVSASNAHAVEVIGRWPGWQGPAVGLIGTEGAGKTHLANVWRASSGAELIAAAALSEASIAEFEARRALVIEDLDRGIADERVLFHILNLAREKKGSVLLTSRSAPGELAITLPDLRSRLRALPLVTIETPDEALLKAVLVKLFGDRQLAVDPHVINHIALHMERSMEAANRVVEAADRLALARQRKVTRAIASEALAAVGPPSGSMA